TYAMLPMPLMLNALSTRKCAVARSLPLSGWGSVVMTAVPLSATIVRLSAKATTWAMSGLRAVVSRKPPPPDRRAAATVSSGLVEKDVQFEGAAPDPRGGRELEQEAQERAGVGARGGRESGRRLR